jgi:16S rRNA (guanine966-N2)-methyltransferase
VRIIGGEFRGRKLAVPKSTRIRPTTDRTRESLFNILRGFIEFESVRVIDMFAGTGALGLEALSCGAAFCLFVEEGVEGRSLIRSNIEALGLTGRTRIYRRDATRLGASGRDGQFDLALLDPPYGKGLGEQAIAALVEGGWLNSGALVVLEEKAGVLPRELEGFMRLDKRQYGDTELGIFALENIR